MPKYFWMQEKYVKFIDFVFDDMKEKYGKTSTFSDLSYYFGKFSGIEITYEETGYLEEKFFHDLFEPLSNVGLFKLSIKALDIIDNFGSYSNYLESQNQEISNYQETKELERKNLELQNENLEYQKTLKDRNEKISKLELRLKRFQIFEKWKILAGTIIFIAGFVLSNLGFLTFLKQLWQNIFH